jgi:hypothetical protein
MQRNLTRNDVVPRATRSSSSPWRQQQQRQADSGTHTTWGEEEAAAAAAAHKEEVVTTSNDKILLRRCLFCCSCFFFCWVLFLAPASCRLNTRYRLRYTTVVCGEGLRRSERRTQVHMKKLLLLLLLYKRSSNDMGENMNNNKNKDEIRAGRKQAAATAGRNKRLRHREVLDQRFGGFRETKSSTTPLLLQTRRSRQPQVLVLL